MNAAHGNMVSVPELISSVGSLEGSEEESST